MNIIEFKEIDSTNTYAKRHMENLADKSVLSADYQTAGRGRFDRTWSNVGVENIYLTIVLKPSDEILSHFACLTQYLSFCLCSELQKIGLNPQVKWPNDVLLEGKKVCGILAEAVIKQGKLKGIALGIGVNLNSDEKTLSKIDRPATSVNLHTNTDIDKKKFIHSLLKTFFESYDDFLNIGFSMIKDFYTEHSCVKGGDCIKIAVFDKFVEGNFVGFDDDGTLILLQNSKNININMGELVDTH